MKSSVMYSNTEELKEILSLIEIKKDGSSSMAEIKALMPKVTALAKELTDIINTEKGKPY